MKNIIKCPKCKGSGQILDSVVKNPLIVLLTLGLSLAITDDCETCNGSGVIEYDD